MIHASAIRRHLPRLLLLSALLAGPAGAETMTLGSMRFEAPTGWTAKTVKSGLIFQKEFPESEDNNRRGAAMIQILGPFAEPPTSLDKNFESMTGMVKAFADERPTLKAEGVTVNGHRIRTDYRCCASLNGVSAGQRLIGLASGRQQAFVSLLDIQLRGEAEDSAEADFAALVRSLALEPSDKPFGLAPAAGDGGLDGVFTHLETGIMPNAFGGTDFYSNSEITVFDPNGLFSTEIPAGGDIAAHCAMKPRDCGLYKVTGGGLFGGEKRIETRSVADDFGTLEVENEPLTETGEGLEIDGTLHTRLPPPPTGTPFAGTWRYFYASSGITATSSTGVAVERVLTLSRDGLFERSGFSGASGTSEAGGGTTGFATSSERPATRGRYRVEGYAIELTGENGQVDRLSLFAPETGSDDLLVIDGANYLKQDGEGEDDGSAAPSAAAATAKRPASRGDSAGLEAAAPSAPSTPKRPRP